MFAITNRPTEEIPFAETMVRIDPIPRLTITQLQHQKPQIHTEFIILPRWRERVCEEGKKTRGQFLEPSPCLFTTNKTMNERVINGAKESN